MAFAEPRKSVVTERCDHSAVAFPAPRRTGFTLAVKRLIDMVGATVFLVTLAPLFLLLAIVVKFSSPGPIFYRWKVVGQAGKTG